MEDNKKNRLFKSLWSREKEEVHQDETVEAAETSEEPVAGTEAKISAATPEEKAAADTELKAKAATANRLDIIYKLYCKWCECQGKEPMEVPFADWVKEPVAAAAKDMGLETATQKAEIFRRQMLLAADKLIRQIEAAEAAAAKYEKAQEEGTAEGLEPVKAPPDIDVDVHVQIPMGGMEAFLMIFPPFGDGAMLDEMGLNQILAEAGLASGLQRDLVKKVVAEQAYFQMFLIAVGKPAIPGEDGKIIEHVPREQEVRFEEDDQGKVDYKEMNLFRKIEEGDLICDILPPGEGTDGLDVRGNVVKAGLGKKADVPAGENTVISEDGKQLLAACNGYVSYEHGKFRVANQLIIRGNVDMSVGNQDFLGDIIVLGDVISGFSLKATGNIVVKGTVEGAALYADGNIEIGDGMNGNNCGELHAGGYVRSPFLENVKVFAGEDIYAQSMISCEAHSHGSICVDEGIGVVIGGSLIAGKAVKARIIGSKAQRKTEIHLGLHPDVQEEKKDKEEKLATIEETRGLLAKNIQLLQMAAKADTLTEEQGAVLKQLKEQEALYGTMVAQLQAEIEDINKAASDYSECYVECATVYPPTKITIASSVYSVESVTNGSTFYYSVEGEVLTRLT